MEKNHLKIEQVHGMPIHNTFAATAAAEPREKSRVEKVLVFPGDYELFYFEEIISSISTDSEKHCWIRIIRDSSQLIFADIDKRDLRWLVELHHFIELNYHQVDFKVPDLAKELSMSVRSLYRKLKSITGLTPNFYLREFRLLTAREMLSSDKFTFVKEVAYGIGFRKPSYFSQVFQERFTLSPKEILDGANT